LKPENILITSKGHLKVTDFGTSSFEEEENDEMRNSFVGTAEYVSPEVPNVVALIAFPVHDKCDNDIGASK
jgi:serine/threonine protein kinase